MRTASACVWFLLLVAMAHGGEWVSASEAEALREVYRSTPPYSGPLMVPATAGCYTSTVYQIAWTDCRWCPKCGQWHGCGPSGGGMPSPGPVAPTPPPVDEPLPDYKPRPPAAEQPFPPPTPQPEVDKDALADLEKELQEIREEAQKVKDAQDNLRSLLVNIEQKVEVSQSCGCGEKWAALGQWQQDVSAQLVVIQNQINQPTPAPDDKAAPPGKLYLRAVPLE